MDTFNLKSHNHRFNKKLSKQLNQLSKLDNYHVILALLQDWSIIFFSILITLHCTYLYPLCLLVIGSRQRALSTIFHDAAHGRVAINKTINLVAGTVFSGFWVFQSINQYKSSHVKNHHGDLGNKIIDPDYQYYIGEGLYNSELTAKDFLFRHVVAVLMLFKAPSYLAYLIKNRVSSAKLYPFEFAVMLLGWAGVFTLAYHYNSLQLIILYWLVPFLTTHTIIGYFIELAEHYPLLGASNQVIELSRNRFSHWLEALFFSMHNENYHLVHHLRPTIPFWNMVKAHKVMMHDEKYSKLNQGFGGIFLSSNTVKPLIVKLASEGIGNVHTKIPTITEQH